MKLFKSDDSNLSPEAKRVQYSGVITFITVSLVTARLVIEPRINTSATWYMSILQGVIVIALLYHGINMMLGKLPATKETFRAIVIACALNGLSVLYWLGTVYHALRA